MIISKTVIYALSCLNVMDSYFKGCWSNVKNISIKAGVPYHYCNKIMQKLVSGGIVESKKGKGFRLLKKVSDISFRDVLLSLNGKSEFKDKYRFEKAIISIFSEIKLSEVIK